MSHCGEDPAGKSSRNVALEQRLQGHPGLQDIPGGAAPGLHSRDPPGSTPPGYEQPLCFIEPY